MELAPGTLLGAYEITGLLGAGGMGEVYRARDQRLQRDVAVKILPAAVADNAAALARFEREARTIAGLSHPNIVAIYDVGREAGVSYAVMELLEGRTLVDALAAGPLPARKALDYARQVAEGLAAAHERGIVHRDIKPGNLFVKADGRIMILDFGLARTGGSISSEHDVTLAPQTMPGMVIGTMGYMAPEQVRGQAIDHRADIFSLGAVLYEMVSGRRAFAGATSADTMSAILTSDPPALTLDGQSTPALDRIIRRCLEKLPGDRFQSTRDLGFALEAVGGTSTTSVVSASSGAVPLASAGASEGQALRRRLGFVPVTVLSLAVGAAVGMGAARWLSPRPANVDASAPVVRFTIPAGLGTSIAVSPDGRSLAWAQLAPGAGTTEIWVRHLDAPAAFAVPGTSGMWRPQWRDDSRRIVAGRDWTLFSIDPDSGAATPMLELSRDLGRTATRDFAITESGAALIGLGPNIVRLPPGTSTPIEVARPDPARHSAYGFPQLLPDGRHVLFVASRSEAGTLDAFVQPIDGGTPVRLDLPTSISRVLVDPAGALVYGRSSSLLGQRFDFATLKPLGEAVVLANSVLTDRTGVLAAAISASNVLAYRTGELAQQRLEWVDRTGRTLGAFGSPSPYTNFDLSPDTARVAAIRRAGDGSNTLWILDEKRGVETQVADSQEAAISDPAWSPDGTRLAYRRGTATVIRNAFGGAEKKVAAFAGYPDSFSRDGRYLTVGRPNGAFYELWAIRIDGPVDEIPLVQGLAAADEPHFAPDGKWIAFHAEVDGSPQVYVIPFPPTGERFQISADGGVQPRWRADGRELYFLDLTGRLMAVDIPSGDPRKAAPARALFPAGVVASSANDQFTPAPDGERFLIRRTLAGADEAPIHVILNWRQLLERK